MQKPNRKHDFDVLVDLDRLRLLSRVNNNEFSIANTKYLKNGYMATKYTLTRYKDESNNTMQYKIC